MKKYAGYGGLVGVLLLSMGLIYYETGKVWNWFCWVTLILGGIGILGFFVLRFQEIVQKVKRTVQLRSFRYGGNALAISLMFLLILGLLNFLVNRHSVRFDLTKGGQFSLSEQTKKVLKNLNKEVRVTAFYKSDTQRTIEDLLKAYRFYSSKFHYEFVDPDKKPGVAKQYGITAYETLVFECGTKTEKITEKDEQALTNALIKVTREEDKVVYFLEGHGEVDIDSNERLGYSMAKKAIEGENYKVKKLNLATEKSIPSDCSILVVCGAQKLPFSSELDTIHAFLERGGKAFFLIDPPPAEGFVEFFDKWGLKIGNDIVLDASGMGQLFGMGPWVPLVTSYPSHPITQKFRVMTFFPYVRSVTPKESPGNGISVQALLKTSASSWGETDLQNPRAQFNKGKDVPGPVTIGVVVTKESSGKKTRLVVFGDSDFANNSYFRVQGNGDLFMNVISWLAEEEDLISIRPKQPEDRRVFMTAKQAKMVMYITVIFMPLLAMAGGVWMYIQRERK